MASIQKIKRAKGSVYKVTIRHNDTGTISKTFKTKRLAVEFTRTVEGDNQLLSSLSNPINKGLTLCALIEEFTNQYTGRDTGLNGRLMWWSRNFGHLTLDKISALVVREGLSLLSSGNAVRGHGRKGDTKQLDHQRSGSTVNRYKAALSSIFEYSKEEYGLTENPCRQIRSKPENKGRTRFLTDTERNSLLSTCKSSEWNRLFLLVLMALTTGARQGELLNLQWKDIDFNAKTAHLWMTKNGEQRLLPLTDGVIAELKHFRGIGIIFPSERNPSKPFYFRKHWTKALIDSKIEDFRFHDLRHSSASFLAMNGATLQEIADILGHKNLQMTMRYSHLCIGHKAKLIDRIMGGIGSEMLI